MPQPETIPYEIIDKRAQASGAPTINKIQCPGENMVSSLFASRNLFTDCFIRGIIRIKCLSVSICLDCCFMDKRGYFWKKLKIF